jgi:hypothetical protein
MPKNVPEELVTSRTGKPNINYATLSVLVTQMYAYLLAICKI